MNKDLDLIERIKTSIEADPWIASRIENLLSDTWACAWWSVEDFECWAKMIEERSQQVGQMQDIPTIFDRDKFKDALSLMMKNHDPCIGINWEVIEHYLVQHCRINP